MSVISSKLNYRSINFPINLANQIFNIEQKNVIMYKFYTFLAGSGEVNLWICHYIYVHSNNKLYKQKRINITCMLFILRLILF